MSGGGRPCRRRAPPPEGDPLEQTLRRTSAVGTGAPESVPERDERAASAPSLATSPWPIAVLFYRVVRAGTIVVFALE